MNTENIMEHVHIGKNGQPYTHTHENIEGHTHSHSHETTEVVLNHLSYSLGKLEEVKGMIQEERDCSEVLIQLSEVVSALNNTGKVILKEHIESCMVEAVECGDKKALDNLNIAIEKFIR